MLHKCWSSIGQVPYCFWRSSVKFQGHTAKKIVDFDLDLVFPDCNSSLNSPMAMKCCTKLETAKERCPIVFQGHPSNFNVTRDKTSPILTQIGRFRTKGRSQLSNPSDLPCLGSVEIQVHFIWFLHTHRYRQTSNIGHTLLGSEIVDHSDVVGASPAGAATTVWYKTKFGSQNFGYQLWCLFCNISNVSKNMFNVGLIIMW